MLFKKEKMIKVYLDDIRPKPEGFDIKVETVEQAIDMLKTGLVELISLDYNLGLNENGTGYDVAKWIEEAAFYKMIKPLEIRVHSADPVGRKNIEMAIKNANFYFNSDK
jgi:hypothetical protein